jgi:hypothetical protein
MVAAATGGAVVVVFTTRTGAALAIGAATVVHFAARRDAATLATQAAASMGCTMVFIAHTGVPPLTEVVPNEDILDVHDVMEFHLGGHYLFDPILTKRTCSDIFCSPSSYDECPSSSDIFCSLPSYDEWPSSSG